MIKRREFIAGVAGAAASAAWPLGAWAQQTDPVRRVGVLLGREENDAVAEAQYAALRQGLESLGWIVGRRLQIERRWAAGDASQARTAAAELLRLTPDVLLVNPVNGLSALQQATRSIPIVFVVVSEPVAQGFVASLARPGGTTLGVSGRNPRFSPAVAPTPARHRASAGKPTAAPPSWRRAGPHRD
jgi:putative ABC transport system substrate-binding protein